MTIISYAKAKSNSALTIEQERALWNFALSCADRHNPDHFDKSKLFLLDGVIRTAPVVIERATEVLGLFPTEFVKQGDEDRYVWISYIKDGDHQGEFCMGDEYGDDAFTYSQRYT